MTNPCIGVCRFDAMEQCLGCYRTKAEVRGWKHLSDTEKAAVKARVRPLIRAAKAGKRLKKLDRKLTKLARRTAKLQAKRDSLLAEASLSGDR